MAHDVGKIPVRYALTPTSAVTYQVSVDIHPDPEEFHPHLSFDYNSRQPESAMGYGWNSGGLSVSPCCRNDLLRRKVVSSVVERR